MEHQTSLVGVVEFVGTDFFVGKLIHLVALEAIVSIVGVLDVVVAIDDEDGGVVSVMKRAVDSVIGVNALEVRGRNLRVEFIVTFLIVIGNRSIRQIDDELLVKLTDGQVRSVRTVDDLEAVVEQGLALVVDHAQQLDGSPGAA